MGGEQGREEGEAKGGSERCRHRGLSNLGRTKLRMFGRRLSPALGPGNKVQRHVCERSEGQSESEPKTQIYSI